MVFGCCGHVRYPKPRRCNWWRPGSMATRARSKLSQPRSRTRPEGGQRRWFGPRPRAPERMRASSRSAALQRPPNTRATRWTRASLCRCCMRRGQSPTSRCPKPWRLPDDRMRWRVRWPEPRWAPSASRLRRARMEGTRSPGRWTPQTTARWRCTCAMLLLVWRNFPERSGRWRTETRLPRSSRWPRPTGSPRGMLHPRRPWRSAEAPTRAACSRELGRCSGWEGWMRRGHCSSRIPRTPRTSGGRSRGCGGVSAWIVGSLGEPSVRRRRWGWMPSRSRARRLLAWRRPCFGRRMAARWRGTWRQRTLGWSGLPHGRRRTREPKRRRWLPGSCSCKETWRTDRGFCTKPSGHSRGQPTPSSAPASPSEA